jgi:hypothetical protein
VGLGGKVVSFIDPSLGLLFQIPYFRCLEACKEHGRSF